jgi:murein DD-endopeptidase MepM/ murein hydrolase activator NlpD
MPDSEVIYSPSAIDFDTQTYIHNSNGYLSTYSEYLGSTGNTSGSEIVQRVASEYSVNPRLLLALLEIKSHWVLGQPAAQADNDYPLGLVDPSQKLLEPQLAWAADTLCQGYYGWREGRLIELTFPDKTKLRLAPDLNAGSVALLYFFTQFDNLAQLTTDVYATSGSLPALEESMFGSPWMRAENVEPLFPNDLAQPVMNLPFANGQLWSFSNGPHPAWGLAGPHAALDFAPSSDQHGCVKSDFWVLAIAPGVVVRSEIADVIVDLDGDGYESTGWDILYQHISAASRIPAGTRVAVGDKIGHPSCEGGPATGTHTHIARKYNGEWIEAGEPLPFVLSGWEAHLGDKPLEGSLTRGDDTVIASVLSMPSSYIYGDDKYPQ